MSRQLNSIGLIVTLASLGLILLGLVLLPWVGASDGETSLTAWQAINWDAESASEANAFLGRKNYAISYDVSVETSDGQTQSEVSSSTISLATAPYGPSSLWILVILFVLALICLGVSMLMRGRDKEMYLSFTAWIAVLGIYGIIILLALFSFHSVNLSTQRASLRNSIISRVEQDATPDVNVTSVIFENQTFPDGVPPNLGIGAWIVVLGMLGLVIQLFIPRDMSRNVNLKAGDRSPEGSGIVQSYAATARGALLSQFMVSAAILFALFPVVFILSSAFNPTGNLSTRSLIPSNIEHPSELFLNFRALMIDELDLFPFWNWLFNSFFVASVTTVLGVLITALSAYSFSRFRFWGRRQLLLGILLMQVFPNLLAMVALFLILQQISTLPEAIPEHLPFLSFIDWSWLNLFGLDSLGGLILVYLGGVMGINTWLMKGFFDSIPRDIDESALVDGASHWQIFWLLIIPLVRPILAVVAILSFVGTFNEFVLARVMLRDKENWTLMVGLFNFINADFNRDWGKFAAGALVSSIPVVVIYIALQDQIVGGLTAGSVKG